MTRYTRRDALRKLGWCAAALAAGPRRLAAAGERRPGRPNIIVILVDDMGFSDIGCYGGEIATPHLDHLAARGIRFTQFYNTGRCCPTRASLLTGLYSHQAGVGHMTADSGLPGFVGHLNEQCVTLGEVMQTAGYFTIMTGKWHVGAKDPAWWPSRRGFDRTYACPEGGGFYVQVKKGRSIVRNGKVIHDADHPLPEGWYSTDAWTDEAIGYIDEAVKAAKPFFVYLAHNAPHFPLQAPPADIERYRRRYLAGWDQLRRSRYGDQVTSGLIEKRWALSPRDDGITPWDDVDAERRDRMDHIMAIYAATVDRMDKSVGRLVQALEQRGVLENTLLLFLSDNGGNAESGPWGRAEGKGPLGSAASSVFCGKSWANAQNTPFRYYKHYVHEGGIATPLIAHWPAGIPKDRHGAFERQPGHLIDIMATCVDLAGATYPKTFKDHEITPMQGVSLAPAFQGKALGRTEPIYWEHEGNRAIRLGKWKLVARGAGGDWELYDTDADRSELHNLADQHPDRVKEMADQWETFARKAHVLPWPWKGKYAAK
ncbi:MAG TPA: arylsulfatase [Phycisphaerae bacterium]|nr:arylsulfatase [Phycisphaerae bacterium]